MNVQGSATRFGNRGGELIEKGIAIPPIQPEAAFDRNRHLDGSAHGRQAVRHAPRLGHQRRTEGALAHPRRWAAHVEIDLREAGVGRELRRLAQQPRIAAAQLAGHRGLGGLEAQQALAGAVNHSPCGDHFGEQQGVGAEQAMQRAAMGVGAGHHRRNRKPLCRPRRRGLRLDPLLHVNHDARYCTRLELQPDEWVPSAEQICNIVYQRLGPWPGRSN